MINVLVLFVALLSVVACRPLPGPELGIEAFHTPEIHPASTGAGREVYLQADTAPAGVLDGIASTGGGSGSGWEISDVDTTSSSSSPTTPPPSELSLGTSPPATKSLFKRAVPTKTINAIIWTFITPCFVIYIGGMASLPGTRLHRWLQACRRRCSRGRYCVCGFRMDVRVSWKDGEWRTRFRDGVDVERDGGVNGWGVQVQEEEEGAKVKVPEKAFLGWRK
ncbi:uncharacterized protein H6S33_003270 [Morchella sextelata]|uniref:uncharacterized protein n=1 Tax=Morchella sextelata TaxID=1174677 RepID=UPI001D0380DB|nr:uncharacterized protein H6S33_003270 [Morchella sextelata]KAH0607282.1 hypothetical protein H6S33_003270 [Morchella sextelata]